MKRQISVDHDVQNEKAAFLALVFVAAFIITGIVIGVSFSKNDPTIMLTLAIFYPLLLIIYVAMKKMTLIVSIDEQFLYVSNGKKEIPIPFSNIKRVSETSGGKYSRVPDILITLKSRSEFGKWIQFKPIDVSEIGVNVNNDARPLLSRFYPRHPIADELRSKIKDDA